MKKVERVGLLAGAGELPLIFADEAKKIGTKVIALAARGITSKELDSHVDKIYWLDLSETKKLPFIFLTERIKDVVLLGKIPKAIFSKRDFSNSEEITSLLNDTKNRLDDSLLREIERKARTFGVRVLNPADFLSRFMPQKGVLTKRQPTNKEWEDIEFGRKIALSIGALDIGQTVVIKNKDVLAVEAIEGTDEAIKRAGKYSSNGAVCVKMLKPKQDPRLDIPTVGIETINSLIEAKASILAVEAGKTFFINQQESIEKADENNISIVAI